MVRKYSCIFVFVTTYTNGLTCTSSLTSNTKTSYN